MMNNQASVTVGKKSFDTLWGEYLRDAQAIKPNTPPGDGWLTRLEFAEKSGAGLVKALEYLREMVKRGRMEVFRGSQITSNGRPARQVWYRPIENKRAAK